MSLHHSLNLKELCYEVTQIHVQALSTQVQTVTSQSITALTIKFHYHIVWGMDMDTWEHIDGLILKKLSSLKKVTFVWVLAFPDEIAEQESLTKTILLPKLYEKGILETTSYVPSR